uniref:Uncharacterized protein orf427 n=1 Tax=Cyanophora paradoxa TaxID=2762 RepID=E9P1G0_CYAPA|nr:hypothetical protein CYPAM_p43 [Cyanophora paradoxa]ADW79212.1 hypothetical protein [Cyanophora paradoxa]
MNKLNILHTNFFNNLELRLINYLIFSLYKLYLINKQIPLFLVIFSLLSRCLNILVGLVYSFLKKMMDLITYLIIIFLIVYITIYLLEIFNSYININSTVTFTIVYLNKIQSYKKAKQIKKKSINTMKFKIRQVNHFFFTKKLLSTQNGSILSPFSICYSLQDLKIRKFYYNNETFFKNIDIKNCVQFLQCIDKYFEALLVSGLSPCVINEYGKKGAETRFPGIFYYRYLKHIKSEYNDITLFFDIIRKFPDTDPTQLFFLQDNFDWCNSIISMSQFKKKKTLEEEISKENNFYYTKYFYNNDRDKVSFLDMYNFYRPRLVNHGIHNFGEFQIILYNIFDLCLKNNIEIDDFLYYCKYLPLANITLKECDDIISDKKGLITIMILFSGDLKLILNGFSNEFKNKLLLDFSKENSRILPKFDLKKDKNE